MKTLIRYVLQDIVIRFPGIDKNFFKLIFLMKKSPAVNLLISYRFCQFLKNKNRFLVLLKLAQFRHLCLENKYLVTFDDCLRASTGLYFPHNGPFVINGHAKLGKNCIIHPNVLIGGDRGKGKSPTVGDNVFIGNGAKIIGGVTIGDWCFITPGAIITKDIPSEAVVGAGLNNVVSMNGRKNFELYYNR